MTYNIRLEDDEIDPDVDEYGYWVDGRVITQRGHHGISTWKLPKQQCVSLLRLGNGLARLSIGSFTRTTVTVTGPSNVIYKLREEVV